MKRRLWTAVIGFDLLVFVAILIIGVYCIWTPGPANAVDSFQSRLVETWGAIGLVPALVFTVALFIASEAKVIR